MDPDFADEVRVHEDTAVVAEADSSVFVVNVWFICFAIGSLGNSYLKSSACRVSASGAVNICPRLSTFQLDQRFCTHPYL